MEVHWKIHFWGGLGECGVCGCMKNSFLGGGSRVESPKKGGLDSLQISEGTWQVGRGWDPSAHYELEEPSYWHKYPNQMTLYHSIITNTINYNWLIVSSYFKKKLSGITNSQKFN